MRPDPTSQFHRVHLSDEEQKLAMSVSPLFIAYLQNKIEAYATAVVQSSLPYHADPKQQVEAIIAHERLKNFIEIISELQNELLAAMQPQTHTN